MSAAPVVGIVGDMWKAGRNAERVSLNIVDIIVKGGRSGNLVKDATGPANSVLKGSQGRIFITNSEGQIIWDVTKDRAKQVFPGIGFGDKFAPTQEHLDLIKKVWGK